LDFFYKKIFFKKIVFFVKNRTGEGCYARETIFGQFLFDDVGYDVGEVCEHKFVKSPRFSCWTFERSKGIKVVENFVHPRYAGLR
jgi:hypothetical protein